MEQPSNRVYQSENKTVSDNTNFEGGDKSIS